MNNRLLVYEYLVAIGITSWAAIRGDTSIPTKNRARYAPWPPTIVMTSVAFGILSLVGAVSKPLAGTLGAGFLLAILTKTLGESKPFELSGIPQSKTFAEYGTSTKDDYLHIVTL